MTGSAAGIHENFNSEFRYQPFPNSDLQLTLLRVNWRYLSIKTKKEKKSNEPHDEPFQQTKFTNIARSFDLFRYSSSTEG
jgi:hypothetical protein